MTAYSLMWPENSPGGTARKPTGWWPPKFSNAALLPNWTAPTFTMDGEFVDLQPNNAGVIIVSAQMRDLIEANKSSVDRIEWLPVLIERGHEIRAYAIPHMLDEIDVIDRKQSVLNRVTGDVVRPHLRDEAIDGHRVFTYSHATGVVLLVVEEVVSALRACTGCYFSKLRSSAAPHAS